MKNLILIIKGFVMGIANIIPGVSGGTLAITMGIYEDLINAISNFLKNIKKNILYLLPIFIGMGLSILTMSNVISFSFKKIPLITTLFFVGLVLGGVPMIYGKISNKKDKKNISNYIIFLITFAFVLVLAFANELFGSGLGDVTLSLSVTKLFVMMLIGMIAAATMIIPGVSGSLVLMLLGYYLPVVNAIKEFTHFDNFMLNFINLSFFGVGVLLGIVFSSKLIEMLFKKYETKTYYGVLGFIISSIIAIPVSVIHEYGMFTFSLVSVIIGLLCLVGGLLIGYKLGEK